MNAVCDAPAVREIRGDFLGFGRDVAGRRQMVLRVGGGEEYLTIPKLLRKRLKRELERGQSVVVEARSAREPGTGVRHEAVARVRLGRDEASPCVTCPIHVCGKKNCWRNGGREVFAALVAEVERRGLAGAVEVKAVGCLDQCRKAPAGESAAGRHRRLRGRDVAAVVAAHAAAIGWEGDEGSHSAADVV